MKESHNHFYKNKKMKQLCNFFYFQYFIVVVILLSFHNESIVHGYKTPIMEPPSVLPLPAQIENEFTPCTHKPFPINDDTRPYSFEFVRNHEPWVAPHIVNPFTLYLFSRSVVFAYLVAGVFEIFELSLQVILGNYIIFVGDRTGTETITDVLLGDWGIQAGIGVALGVLFVWALQLPKRWMPCYQQNRHGWWRHILFYLLWNVPILPFGWVLDPFCKRIHVGASITIITQTLLIMVYAFRFNQADIYDIKIWGRDAHLYYTAYFSWIALNFFIYYSVFYNWAFSSYVQSWIVSVSVAIVLLFVGVLNKRRHP